MKLSKFLLFSLTLSLALPAAPQQARSNAAASASTAVPPLIPYSGVVGIVPGAQPAAGASITFLIYKDEQGGEPLFAETQSVAIDATGHYRAQLGATLTNGIPMDLFATGEARWLEVQVAGEAAQPRVLLVSVPYALKAADAATLGGLPPSAFALAHPASDAASAVSPAITPNVTSNVTTTGGIAGYVPEFSGATSILDSPVFVNGANVGIGTTTPGAKLEINGTALITGGLTAEGGITLGGKLSLPATGTATVTAGSPSQILSLADSVFNSSVKLAVPQTFQWLAAPIGNDTTSATSALELLFGTGTATPTATGLSIGANGKITFAPGQTFPGTADGTITGVTAGTDLTGGGTAGVVTLNLNTTVTDARYARLTAANSFTGNQAVNGSVTATSFAGSGSALTGVVAANSAELGGLAPDSYAVLSANNAFTGIQGFSRVGIGTTTPRSLLEIQASASEALGPVLTLTNTLGGTGAESALDFNTVLPSTTGTYNPMARIVAQDANHFSDNLLFQSNNPTPHAQNSGLQTNMIITSTGLVGIDTTTPTSQLQVNGTVTATSFAGIGTALTGVVASNSSELGGLAPSAFAQVGSANTFSTNQTVNGSVKATSFSGSGAGLTGVVAANSAALGGLVPAAYALLAAGNTFTANQTITGNLGISGTASAGTVNAGTAFDLGGSLFAFGSEADGSVFLGFSGNTSSTGNDNTATGYQALYSNTMGAFNSAHGYQALFSNTMGEFNSAEGYQALYSNIGDGTRDGGGGNTATGYQALYSNTMGGENTADGYAALLYNVGFQNTAIGYLALTDNSSAFQNTAVGVGALGRNTTGGNNTAIGVSSLLYNSMGQGNTAIGSGALIINATGSFNTGVGLQAGTWSDGGNPPLTGSFNTAVGTDSGFGDGSISNATAIGAYAEAIESNTMVLGCVVENAGCLGAVNVGIGTSTPDSLLTVNGSADKPGGGSWGTYSDGRLKNVGVSFSGGLGQVMQLRPVHYRYKPDNALGIRDADEHIGVVAQEVQRVIPEAVTENGKGYLLVNNDPIIWSMVNAIKEQQKEIEEQRKLLRAQSAAMRSLAAEVRETRKTLRQVKAQAAAEQIAMVASK